MGELISNTAAFLFIGLGFISLFSAGLLAVLYVRKERRQRNDWEKTEADKADIMLLFQTMRDVIGQQKNLARDFNEELERKMKLVKQILAQSMEKNERLYDKQQQLAQELEEARAELRSLQRQTGFLKEHPPTPEVGSTESARARRTPPSPSEPFVSLPGEDEAEEDVFEEPDRFTGTGLAQSPPETWIAPELDTTQPAQEPTPATKPGSSAEGFREIIEGLSNGSPQSESADVYLDDENDEELDVALDSPQEVTEARNAFRSLLDMPATAPTASAAPNGNGGRSPLQQRVVEYHDAGMPVGDIARELGIGKGEVRLMLSLARQEKG